MCIIYIIGFVGIEIFEYVKVYLFFGLVKVRCKLCVINYVVIFVYEVVRSINVCDFWVFEVLGVFFRYICDSLVIGVFDFVSLVNG